MPFDALLLLKQLLPSVPTILVLVGGLVLALALGRRAPRASLLAVIALVGKLVLTLVQPAIWWFLTSHRGENLYSTLGIVSGLMNVLHAVALSLLVAAVFVDRPPAAAPFAPPPPPPPYGPPR